LDSWLLRELGILATWQQSPFANEFAKGLLHFTKMLLLNRIVGEYAGGQGFLLPNSVFQESAESQRLGLL